MSTCLFSQRQVSPCTLPIHLMEQVNKQVRIEDGKDESLGHGWLVGD